MRLQSGWLATPSGSWPLRGGTAEHCHTAHTTVHRHSHTGLVDWATGCSRCNHVCGVGPVAIGHTRRLLHSDFSVSNLDFPGKSFEVAAPGFLPWIVWLVITPVLDVLHPPTPSVMVDGFRVFEPFSGFGLQGPLSVPM